jgi:hypothetical protein
MAGRRRTSSRSNPTGPSAITFRPRSSAGIIRLSLGLYFPNSYAMVVIVKCYAYISRTPEAHFPMGPSARPATPAQPGRKDPPVLS